ncbi:MAG: c-type cytochrome domain-containing protein [Gallionella sp.]
MKNRILLGGIVVAALSFLVMAIPALAVEEVSYKKDIRPILDDYCLNCHKPGGKGYKKSGLDVRTYKSLMKGTKFGTVIKPGDSYTSILIQVVDGRVHSSIKMPYGMEGSLAKGKIELLRKWVQQGAKNN